MKKKSNKSGIVFVLIMILGLGLLGFNNFTSFSNPNPSDSTSNNSGDPVPCVNPALPVPAEYHIHPELKIVVNGENVVIPTNIGLGVVSCERALHTHDTTGAIHIEPNFYKEFRLKDFFWVWEKTFSKDQVLDSKIDNEHEIVMTVDNEPSTDFENLILKDKQKIVIEYKKKG